MRKDCALDQVELEMLCIEFSDEALEIQAAPERDQPMRNTTLLLQLLHGSVFLSWALAGISITSHERERRLISLQVMAMVYNARNDEIRADPPPASHRGFVKNSCVD
jgi:hypothetical protein